MGDLIKYKYASASSLDINRVDVIYCASLLEGLPLSRETISTIVDGDCSSIDEELVQYVNGCCAAIDHISKYCDSTVDLSYTREVYHELMKDDEFYRDKLNFVVKKTLLSELHRVFEIKDAIGASDVLFSYIIWREVFSKYNITAALLIANAYLVCNGAGTLYAGENDSKFLSPLVKNFVMETCARQILYVLKKRCHNKILHAW